MRDALADGGAECVQDVLAELGLGREVGRGGEAAAGGLEARADGLPNDLAEERFLVREVEVDGALGDPGASGDVVEAGAVEPLLVEDGEGGVEDLLWSLVRGSASSRIEWQRHLW